MAAMTESRKYVFITGFARSGTSLLANLLNRQPRVTVWSDGYAGPLAVADAVGGFRRILDPAQRSQALARHKLALDNQGARTELTTNDFTTAAELYRRALDELGREDDIVVGHKVTGYGPHTDVFRHILDETDVHCICILRDVRDVVLSQRHRTGTAIDPDSWSLFARRSRALQGHPRLVVIRYEDLIRNPEATLAPIEALLGIRIDTRVETLAYRGSESWTENSSFHDVGRLFDPRPIERWREHVGDPAVRFAAWWCADELERWGYAKFPEAFAWRERARFARATAVRAAMAQARPLRDAVRRLRNP